MISEMISALTADLHHRDKRIHGVTLCKVVSNTDQSGLGRVQISVPSLPGYQPWARVATLSAGSQRGTYFIPQQDEEVLVIFNQGCVNDPFVLGTLWNGQDKPPFTGLTDPQQKRAIRTPQGHEVLLDDAEQTIVIRSAAGPTITLAKDRIELKASDSTRLTLATSGTVTIEAATQIELKAPNITVTATSKLGLAAKGSATLDGGANCIVKGAMVNIN
ncbi:MAG: phage baseplate assembly protein V [Gammaproteobacteria bacterium]